MKIKVLLTILAGLFLFGTGNAQTPGVQFVPTSTKDASDEKVDPARVKGYLLGPGDQINIEVPGEPEFKFSALTIDDEGRLEVPYIDHPIIAQCRTERDIRAEITKDWEKYLKNPQVNLGVVEYGKSRPEAMIYGEVRSATKVKVMNKKTLSELIAFAGGVTDDAAGVVQVSRPQPPVCADKDELAKWTADATVANGIPSRSYSLSAVMSGQTDSNPIIYPGDIVQVPRALPVWVTGEIANPQGIWIKENGLSLTEAIAKLGGLRQGAKTKDIKIYRLKEAGKSELKDRDTLSANYDMIKKGQQKDIMLRPYDIVEIDQAKDSMAMSILKIAIGAGKSTMTSVTQGVGYHVWY